MRAVRKRVIQKNVADNKEMFVLTVSNPNTCSISINGRKKIQLPIAACLKMALHRYRINVAIGAIAEY